MNTLTEIQYPLARRSFLRYVGALCATASAAPLTACGGGETTTPVVLDTHAEFWAPKEGGLHAATWMAYGATLDAWGADPQDTKKGAKDFENSIPVAREDLMRMAAQLSRFEPVILLVSDANDEAEARQYLDDVFAATAVRNQLVQRSQADLNNAALAFDTSGKANYVLGTGVSSLPPMNRSNIRFVQKKINDLWTRDTAPVFVKDAKGDIHGVNFNFNGWGQEAITTGLRGYKKDPEKAKNGIVDQRVTEDRQVAAYVLQQTRVPEVKTWLTMEGGGIELNGRGLAVATDSCLVNDNRNPGVSRAYIEAELRRVLGIEKLIWVPGVKALDITDGHVDFAARFTDDSTMVYTWDGGLLPDGKTQSTDAKVKLALEAYQKEVAGWSAADKKKYLGDEAATLKLVALASPDIAKVKAAVQARNPGRSMMERANFNDTFAAGYVGFYEANGCILMAQFGDAEADKAALKTLSALYPERTVLQIVTDGVGNGGGTIHCATQQQIK